MNVTLRSAPIGARLTGTRGQFLAKVPRSKTPEEFAAEDAAAARAAGPEASTADPAPPSSPPVGLTVDDRLTALEATSTDHETRIVACETQLGIEAADASGGEGGEVRAPPSPDPAPARAAASVARIDERAVLARHGEHRAAMAARQSGRSPAVAAPAVPGKPLAAGATVLDAGEVYARLRASRTAG